MSAEPDLTVHFRALETLCEAQPEGVRAEIAHGIYMMSPRPRPRHANVQGNLAAILNGAFGSTSGLQDPDWVFLIEPETRSVAALSRLSPDAAGWRKSTTGWSDADASPIDDPMPEWACEVVSPGSERCDRREKREAYGLVGVGWFWLVDPKAHTVETFENVRGKLLPRKSFVKGEPIVAEPFETLSIQPRHLFVF